MISVSLTVSPSNLHPTIITEARNPGSPLISWRGSPQQLLRDHISIHVSTGVYGWNALKTHSRKTCSLDPDISRAHCLCAEKDKKISILTPCRAREESGLLKQRMQGFHSGRWQQEAASISVFIGCNISNSVCNTQYLQLRYTKWSVGRGRKFWEMLAVQRNPLHFVNCPHILCSLCAA